MDIETFKSGLSEVAFARIDDYSQSILSAEMVQDFYRENLADLIELLAFEGKDFRVKLERYDAQTDIESIVSAAKTVMGQEPTIDTGETQLYTFDTEQHTLIYESLSPNVTRIEHTHMFGELNPENPYTLVALYAQNFDPDLKLSVKQAYDIGTMARDSNWGLAFAKAFETQLYRSMLQGSNAPAMGFAVNEGFSEGDAIKEGSEKAMSAAMTISLRSRGAAETTDNYSVAVQTHYRVVLNAFHMGQGTLYRNRREPFTVNPEAFNRN